MSAPLVLAGGAYAHAGLTPPVAKAKTGQIFTLAVPTEKENAATTKVELIPPSGFSVGEIAPSPGWKLDVQSTGSGDETKVQKVTWSGGSVPTGQTAVFPFLGFADASKTYVFSVRQTYSDGSVVDWSGAESSDTPAPRVEAVSSLGGGGSSTLALIALVVGAVGLLVGVVGLTASRRPLT